MVGLLEFERRDGVGCDVQGQTRLVRLVHEVPHVDAIRLSDEQHARAGRRERTARVMSLESIARAVNRSILVESCLPNSEVEIMDCHDELLVEGRSL